jgi:GNAT superfamily N-acetyltransferase
LPPHRALRRGAAVIRPARDDDAAGIVAVVAASWREYPGCVVDIEGEAPELFSVATYAASRGGAAWVAERDGDVAGLVCTWPLAAGDWELAKVYVARAHRGGGLAHQLADTAEAFARERGATRMRLWSDTRFDRAHMFYHKRSFVRAGAIRALDDKSHSIEFAYAKPLTGVVVERLDAAAAASAEYGMARALVACVNDGAAVSFLPPMTVERALAFWRKVSAAVARGEKILLAAWCDGNLAGTVQLDLATPENQPHRADVAKMLVHPQARRRGIGRALLARAEAEGVAAGRTLLTLDTREGDFAEALYRGAGWTECGRIPDYALNADRATAHATVLFCKRLTPIPAAPGTPKKS